MAGADERQATAVRRKRRPHSHTCPHCGREDWWECFAEYCPFPFRADCRAYQAFLDSPYPPARTIMQECLAVECTPYQRRVAVELRRKVFQILGLDAEAL